MKRGVRSQFVLTLAAFPETPAVAAYVPVGQVIDDEITDGAAGCRGVIVLQPLRNQLHQFMGAGEQPAVRQRTRGGGRDRKSTRLNSSHVAISYAVFCLKKKNSRSIVQQIDM